MSRAIRNSYLRDQRALSLLQKKREVCPSTTTDGTSDDGDEFVKEDEELTLQEIYILPDRKAQYLHRTVKDFLEQPEIWDRIVAATGAKFHPYTALYASYLLQLKSLDPESMTKTQL